MKMIGFRKEYDKMLINSKYIYEVNHNEMLPLAKNEMKMVAEYLEKSDMVFSKTLALFDGEKYIGPYMIFSDGEWIWPSYYSYNLVKEEGINSDFLFYVRKRKYSVMPLTSEQKKKVTFLLEKEILRL